MTLYRGPEAEKAMMAGMLVAYEYSELMGDMTAMFLGYKAWQHYTDFNSQEVVVHPWVSLQLKYEILYYIWGVFRDLKKKDSLIHHIMCLGYLYFGWQFKMALSTSFYFASISNLFMSLMRKHPNKLTKLSFATSFVIARIGIGSWVMKKVLGLPVTGKSVAIVPMTGTVYVLQWFWLKKIIKLAIRSMSNGGGTAGRS